MSSAQKLKMAVGFGALSMCCLLAGCGTVPAGDSPLSPVSVAGSAIKGQTYGGQQPVAGATIQLYAVGSTGYGSSYSYANGTSLFGSTVIKTDSNGNFSVPAGAYTCPSASTEVYVTATGGNPGLGSNAGSNPPNNTALALMAALGPCSSLAQTFVNINEVTTIASVWALAGFMTGPTSIGSSASNTAGLVNAFSTVNSLVNTATGTAGGPGLPANATIPTAKLYTLANIIATCVNSAGGVAGDGSQCGKLFTNTTVNNVAPTDTITAALNIAHNPQQNLTALTYSPAPTAPFAPSLATPPNDFNLVISYAAGGFSTPRAVAVDTAGNIWVPNAGTSSVTEMTATGSLISPALGYTFGSLNAPVAIATDQSGNAWVANNGSTTATKILAGGSGSTAYTVGATPSAVSIDAFGSAFVTNAGGNSVSRITTGGLVTTTVVSGVAGPIGLAMNPK